MTHPENLRYTKDHEWIRVEGPDRSVGVVGITDFAQGELGDIVYVELPKPGAKLEAGKPFGSVESVKAVSDLCAPVSGEVVEVNEALSRAPETVNASPHDVAWMIKVKLSDPAQVESLMTAEEYETYISEQGN
ncbi:MAG: glycine cleavage system protein GcvH [Acidobacteriota bacterium]|nr:MAG: glycine cleavage system protein GcvH [Acidobacteriota bacterium]